MRDVTASRRFLLKWAVPVAGIASLAIPVWLMVAWIVVFHNGDTGQEARVAAFMSMLPGFMREPASLTLIALACSIIGVVLGTICVPGNRGAVRAAGIAEIALGTALACLLLFSLM